jgi:phosphatidylserine/phosphatidylglycerophosphate/cardiolipin synthase-like enzyme
MPLSFWKFCLCLLFFTLGGCALDADAREPVKIQAVVGSSVEALFTPGDKIARRIVDLIDAAKQDVKVQAYGFTNTAITNALIAAKRRGVDVQIIEDDGEYLNINGFSKLKLDSIKAAGAKIYLDDDHAIAHNKIMLIDSATPQHALITGSYNFTQAAEKNNAENVLLIRNSPQLAAEYLANWQKHLAHSNLLP